MNVCVLSWKSCIWLQSCSGARACMTFKEGTLKICGKLTVDITANYDLLRNGVKTKDFICAQCAKEEAQSNNRGTQARETEQNRFLYLWWSGMKDSMKPVTLILRAPK